MYSFNPSYGLHALRAHDGRCGAQHRRVSIPHMGCMPYGLVPSGWEGLEAGFQSLIWVACPTGIGSMIETVLLNTVSIPHMGCMPYGL